MKILKFKLLIVILTPYIHYIYKNRKSEKDFDDIVEAISDVYTSSFIEVLENDGWNKIKIAWNRDLFVEHCKQCFDYIRDVTFHDPVWSIIILSIRDKVKEYYGI